MKITATFFVSAAIAWALPVSAATDAEVPSSMMSMAGVADTGDQIELRFEPAPSHHAQLVVKGNRTGKTPGTFPVTYEEIPASTQQMGNPIVIISFSNGKKMTIVCDPLSNLCHADSYPTFDGLSFSISWSVTRAVTSDSSKFRVESASRGH
jgi:hypothetical protein